MRQSPGAPARLLCPGEDSRDEVVGALTTADRSLRDLFAVDLRSLALFRIGLASLVLLDLAGRAPGLVELYSEAGVLPVATLGLLQPRAPLISIHAHASASPFALALLFALAAAAGARTRRRSPRSPRSHAPAAGNGTRPTSDPSVWSRSRSGWGPSRPRTWGPARRGALCSAASGVRATSGRGVSPLASDGPDGTNSRDRMGRASRRSP